MLFPGEAMGGVEVCGIPSSREDQKIKEAEEKNSPRLCKAAADHACGLGMKFVLFGEVNMLTSFGSCHVLWKSRRRIHHDGAHAGFGEGCV